jgi:hypothetical protein
MGEVYSAHGRDGKCINNFSRKFEEKRMLGKLGHRWVHFKETGFEDVDDREPAGSVRGGELLPQMSDC